MVVLNGTFFGGKYTISSHGCGPNEAPGDKCYTPEFLEMNFCSTFEPRKLIHPERKNKSL